MAAGKAVVATTVGGNVEAVSYGVTGFVPPVDAASMPASTIALLADRRPPVGWGSGPAATCTRPTIVGAMVRAYEGIYPGCWRPIAGARTARSAAPYQPPEED